MWTKSAKRQAIDAHGKHEPGISRTESHINVHPKNYVPQVAPDISQMQRMQEETPCQIGYNRSLKLSIRTTGE